MWTRTAAALALLGAAGCTLADVVVPESEDVLVVEAVLRTDLDQQIVVLHRSVRGRASAPEPGARVVVRSPGRASMQFTEAARECIRNPDAYSTGPDSLEVQASCYYAWGANAAVVPGATYELEVTTARGERARGTTTVPGDFTLLGLPSSGNIGFISTPCALAPGTELPVRWTRSVGAWGYIAPLRMFGLSAVLPPEITVPEPLELLGIAVSASDTEIVLPSEFGVFERFQIDQELLRALQGGLPAGTRAELTIAAADRNYINGVRGGSFNPSGRVRISSVTGDGVGVFASLVPLRAIVEAGPPTADRPPCGAA